MRIFDFFRKEKQEKNELPIKSQCECVYCRREDSPSYHHIYVLRNKNSIVVSDKQEAKEETKQETRRDPKIFIRSLKRKETRKKRSMEIAKAFYESCLKSGSPEMSIDRKELISLWSHWLCLVLGVNKFQETYCTSNCSYLLEGLNQLLPREIFYKRVAKNGKRKAIYTGIAKQ